MRRYLPLAAILLVVCGMGLAHAVDRQDRFFDRSQVRVFTGDASCDTADQDWTSYASVCTITPATGHALQNVEVLIDLAKATSGFAAGHTSETITFIVARKVDGSNYRVDEQSDTTAISGTNAAGTCVRLNLGTVGATECAVVKCKVSAEATDFDLPVVIYYRSADQATVGVVE